MMEEDTERLTLNLNSKRRSKRRSSSILKTTIGPLLDIDPNKQDGCTVPLKKSRQSLSKRVSFAKRHEIKEFPRDSPRRWEDSTAQEPAANTRNDTSEVTAAVSNQQGVTNISEGQHGSSQLPLLSSTSGPYEGSNFNIQSHSVGGHLTTPEASMITTNSAVGCEQPKQWGPESKVDGSSLLKSLSEASTQHTEGLELGYHTQSRKGPGLGCIDDGRDTKVNGMALLQALSGGDTTTPSESEPLSSYTVKESTTQQAAANNWTMMFPENEYMDQTEALTCHIQLREAEACLKGLKERTPLMALKEQTQCDRRYGAQNSELSDRTIMFSQDDDAMQQTEVLTGGLLLNSQPSGPVNRQSLLQSLGGSDETDSPEVLFGKKFETINTTTQKQTLSQDITSNQFQHNLEKSQFKGYDIAHQREPTIVFQQGLEMEETRVIPVHIETQHGLQSAEAPEDRKVLFYLGDNSEEIKPADNPMLRSLGQNSEEKTLIYQDGANMEQTGVLESNILSNINKSTLQQPDSRVLIFQDDVDMGQTGVQDNKISRGSLSQRPVNQTVVDGADMEQTEVLDTKISRRSLSQRPVNQTVVDGADMEQTEVLDSKISRRSLSQRPVNQTVVDGADMEQTEVLDTKISRRSLSQRPINQTINDGADMEQTGVIPSNISSNRSVLQQSSSKTQIFQNGADMEETGVIPSNILSNRSSLHSGSKTQIFQDGVDMEHTEVLDTKISRRSLSQRPVNQTVVDGADMEQTSVIPSNILSNRSVLHQSSSKTQIFQDGADMEETGVISNNILSNRSSLHSGSKTQIFQDGADMEQTEVLDSKISRRSLSQRPVNQTINEGADMEQTEVLVNSIQNRSLTHLSVNKRQIDGIDMELTRGLESTLANGAMNKVDSCNTQLSEKIDQSIKDGVDVEETHVATSNINIHGQDNEQTSQSVTPDPVTPEITQVNKNNKSSLTASARLKRLSARFSLGGDSVSGRLSKGTCGESELDGDQTQSISRNTIRLAGPTPNKGEERPCVMSMEGSKEDISPLVTADMGLNLPQTTAQATENTPQTTNMVTEEPSYQTQSLNNTSSKQTIEMDTGITDILPPLDLGITEILPPSDLGSMLPPGDIVTEKLNTSTMADLPMMNKTKDEFLEQKDNSGSDLSQSQSVISYSVISNYSNYSMTESMLESTRRDVDGPLTVKKLCLLLDVPCLRWLEYQFRNDRCSILPGEQIDTSDLRNVLRACAVQCPFYLVHSHIYTQAAKQADLKKQKTDELDVVFTQEESKPELFRAVEQSTEEQKKSLREKVLACSKVSSLLGKTQWKNVRTEATLQYRETLKDQFSRLQNQASDVSTALQESQGLLTALDTAWSNLEIEEAELENTKLPSGEEILQWKVAKEELFGKVTDLQQLEGEQTKLTSDRDRIQSELAILRDQDQQSNGGQSQDVKLMLEKLQEEDVKIAKDLNWMEKCLEWRIDHYEKESVSYLFYDNSLLLETTLDTSQHCRLLSATLTSNLQYSPTKPVNQFSDRSEDIMSLIHRLIIKSVQEQNVLTKFIGTPLKEQYKFLRAVSMIVCTGRCLGQEITRIEFNNWVKIQEHGLSVEFWCDEAKRKIDIDFDLKLKYRDYSVVPSVRMDIGKFRPEDVEKQLRAVPVVGFRYFERLCQAINLNDMTVIPELDCCS